MSIGIAKKHENSYLQRFLSLFMKAEKRESDVSAAEFTTSEIDKLWSVVRDKNDGVLAISDNDCMEKISDSFMRIKEKFSNEQLDNAYTWPRYVKVAVYCGDKPLEVLVNYINETNYIYLTKRLSDLCKSVSRGDDPKAMRNVEIFSEAVCYHILDTIDSDDIPSCLTLGRIAQKKGNYEAARQWYEKITETDQPFNGITSLMACYEEETKSILSHNKKRNGMDPGIRKRVKELNDSQCAVYEKWRKTMEERIYGSSDVQEEDKKEYVYLMTRYARFERNRGNYNKAFEILGVIPESYPDSYRVYSEMAMLYQFKPNKNRFYSLDEAIKEFKKAEEAMDEDKLNDRMKAKSKKSILMPLANSYFMSGRYEEAKTICENVLKIDENEQRAIKLRDRIARLVA